MVPTRKELQLFNEVINLSSKFKTGANSSRMVDCPYSTANNQPLSLNGFYQKSINPNNINSNFSSKSSGNPVASPLNLSLPYLRNPPALVASNFFSSTSEPNCYKRKASEADILHQNGSKVSIPNGKNPLPRRRVISSIEVGRPQTSAAFSREQRSASESTYDDFHKSVYPCSSNSSTSPMIPFWKNPFLFNRFAAHDEHKSDPAIGDSVSGEQSLSSSSNSIASEKSKSFVRPNHFPQERKPFIWNPSHSLEEHSEVSNAFVRRPEQLSQFPWLAGGQHQLMTAELQAILQKTNPFLFLPVWKQMSSQCQPFSFQPVVSPGNAATSHLNSDTFKSPSSTLSLRTSSANFNSSSNFSRRRPISSSSYDSGCTEAESEGSEGSSLEDDKHIEVKTLLKTENTERH